MKHNGFWANSSCGESRCRRQRQHLDEESQALGNAEIDWCVQEGSIVWKDTDGVNSLLCGQANALKPPSHETCNYQGSVNQE